MNRLLKLASVYTLAMLASFELFFISTLENLKILKK